jgi:peptide chain release factor 2
MNELLEQFQILKQRIQKLVLNLKLEEKKTVLAGLQAQTLAPDFWQDDTSAKQVLKEVSKLEQTVTAVETAASRTAEWIDLCELSLEEGGDATDFLNAAQKGLETITLEVEALEVELFLSGPYDTADAIVSIHAGQGGVEAQDWAEMLLRL